RVRTLGRALNRDRGDCGDDEDGRDRQEHRTWPNSSKPIHFRHHGTSRAVLMSWASACGVRSTPTWRVDTQTRRRSKIRTSEEWMSAFPVCVAESTPNAFQTGRNSLVVPIK